MDLDALLSNATAEVFLEETDWLTEKSPQEREAIYAEFGAHFQRWLAALASKLGQPTLTRETEPDVAADLYFEAIDLAAWAKGQGFLVLAFGQHDQETPVFVSLGYREVNAA